MSGECRRCHLWMAVPVLNRNQSAMCRCGGMVNVTNLPLETVKRQLALRDRDVSSDAATAVEV